MRREKFDLFLEKHLSPYLTNHTTEGMRFITEHIPPSKYNKMLNIGCGEGRETFVLKQLGYDVVGITVGDINIKYARENFPSIDIRLMDMHDLEFSYYSFNAIYMNHTFEHSIAPFVQLIEMHRVLTDDPLGLLWISLPSYQEHIDRTLDHTVNASIDQHHRNMLSPMLFRQLFNVAFNIKKDLTNMTIHDNVAIYDQRYLLEKKPYDQLHPDIRKLIEELQGRFR